MIFFCCFSCCGEEGVDILLVLVWGFIMSIEFGFVIEYNLFDKGKLFNGYFFNYNNLEEGEVEDNSRKYSKVI